MREWILFERYVAESSGLDHDALILLAAFSASLFVAFVSRRPLASFLPWLIVLLLGVAHEAAVALADGAATDSELWTASRRMALFMFLPTTLALLGRLLPQLLVARPDRRILVPAIREKRAPVVNAVFKKSSSDVPPNASAS